MSELTHLPLCDCVFRGISQKVESIVIDYYYERGFVYCDLNNPFTKGFNVTKTQAKDVNLDALKPFVPNNKADDQLIGAAL